MKEIVQDNQTGLHFSPGDDKDLAEKVEWAWNHPGHMRMMGEEARHVYEMNYTAEKNLDGNGEAVVSLPGWFQALNRNFRYQLTSIGSFAPVYIAEEMQNGQFKIAGGRSGIKVSWQVTGIGQDAFANAHRIQVEVEKAPSDRGHYLHPELFGAPETARIGYVASKMKSIPVEHQRRALPRRGNASPLPQRTPPSMPIPLRPAPPNPTPPLRSLAPAAQGNKLELNQK